MPNEKKENAAALIKKADEWIKRTRQFTSNIEDQHARNVTRKIYQILEFQNQALEKLLKDQTKRSKPMESY